jgi:hypothetical protein
MKAVVVENHDTVDNVALKDVAQPEISPGMVRVRIQAASVGFVDGLKVRGLYQTKDPCASHLAQSLPEQSMRSPPMWKALQQGRRLSVWPDRGGLLSTFASQLQRSSSGRKAWRRKLARRSLRIISLRSIR